MKLINFLFISKYNSWFLIQISKLLDVDLIELINFKDDQIFNNTFNDESKGFFNIKELILENFNFTNSR